MKTKKLLLMIPFLFLMMGIGGCNDKLDITGLYHTWKLEGFGDIADNFFEKATPADCEKCFVLTFSEDGTLSGYTTTNTVFGTYSVNERRLKIISFGGTLKGELGHGYKYSDTMQLIEYYELTNAKLKLFYNQGQNYLLFNFLK